jgi:eukaryotic translation initiation factor 2C
MHIRHSPDFGDRGRRMRVRTNCYPIMDLPRKNIHHYDVQIDPETPPKINRLVMSQWETENRQGLLKAILPVYDGRHGLFAPADLMLENDVATFTIQLPDEEEDDPARPPTAKRRGPRMFNVVIKKVSVISISKLFAFLQGRFLETPQDTIMALDVAFRHLPSTLYTPVGRNFFSPENAMRISGGAELWSGFHQAVRPAGNALVLNVDLAGRGGMVHLCSVPVPPGIPLPPPHTR